MRSNAFGLYLCGALMIMGALPSAVSGRDPDPKLGMKVFYEKGCIRCHPFFGEGGKVGPDLTRSSAVANGLELSAAMWSHAPQMWQRMEQERLPLPTFQAEQMEDLFAFLQMARSIDDPGNAEVGRRLFQTKRCVECHSIRGEGGKVGPDLKGVAGYRNTIAWVAAMWNHAPGMFRALSQKNIPLPRFEGSELVDLEAYIRLMAGTMAKSNVYLRSPSAAQGTVLFQSKRCIYCHSVNGQGGKIGPDLGTADLPLRYGEIAPVIWNHAPQMSGVMATLGVPYPRFETQELADVVAYLNSLSLSRPGNSAKGASIFQAKGCAGCHGTRADGGEAPKLTHLQPSLTPVSIARIMWNHGPAMLQRMEKTGISWPVFNSKELADTLAFLASIQTNPSPSPPAEKSEASLSQPVQRR